jgi:hypothetical protein
MTEGQSEMPEPRTAESILSELETHRGYFPREAVAAAIAAPELVTPALLQSLRYATDEAEHIATERTDYMAHLYAMYLLAQFRETRAYPLVAGFASLPGERMHEVAGDFVTEALGRVLASVCGGDQRLIRELIEDEEIDDFVRGEAAHALVCLVVSGQAEREDVLAYFGELLRTDLARRPSHALDDLILLAARLCPTGIIDEIRAAFECEAADEGYISREDVEKHLRAGPEAALEDLSKDRYCSLIDDTIQEMERWVSFQEDGSSYEVFDAPAFDPPPSLPAIGRAPSPEPIHRETRKVGRNEPCPCGSGRKHKKCCGR